MEVLKIIRLSLGSITILNTKFVKLRPFVSGRTLILYDNETLFK